MSKHDSRKSAYYRERLQSLFTPTDADLAAVDSMSEAELDAELAAAGIDFAAFEQRLQRTLAETRPQPVASEPALPAGLAWVRRGSRRWLQATLDGLENLRRTCAPLPQVLDAVPRDSLPGALQAGQWPVVVLSLHAVPGGVRLAVRWLADAPATAPAVHAWLDGTALPRPAQWLDWQAAGERTQGLFLPCDLSGERLKAHAGPVLAHAWDAATGCFECELLPGKGGDDGE